MGTVRAWEEHETKTQKWNKLYNIRGGSILGDCLVWSFHGTIVKTETQVGPWCAWGYIINSPPPSVRDQLWQSRHCLWPLGTRKDGLTQQGWSIAAGRTSPSSSQKVRSETSIPRSWAEGILPKGRKVPPQSKHLAFIRSHPAPGGVKWHPQRENSKGTGG